MISQLLIFVSVGGCLAGPHPLDPLSPGEIHSTAVIIRSHNSSATWIFNRINLYEPDKALLLPFYLKNEQPQNVPRKAFAVILNSKTESAVEVIVNLSEKKVESWSDLPGTHQPGTNRADRELAKTLVTNDVEVQERCRKLGWANMSLVDADIWPVGYIGDREDVNPANRLLQAYFYGTLFPSDNPYAHPFNFVAILDMKQQRVVSIESLPTRDDCGVPQTSTCNAPVSVPRDPGNYDPDILGGSNFVRSDLSPIRIKQPGGASFKIADYLVQWQKFQFRVGFNEREGLVIHQVGYYDNEAGTLEHSKFRPLFYRLSLSEAFIPYADPRPPFQRKAAYDMGELDIGITANELNEQLCIGENARFLDAHITDPHGEPKTLRNAICLYEEDAGLLWKHTNYRDGKNSLVRNQRLNVVFMVTLGNYDYMFLWHFYQDASIQYEVKLTGILSTVLADKGTTPGGYGTLVAPQVNAQYHQHIFVARVDPEVDGNKNTVGTLDVVPQPGSRYGNSFTTRLTTFRDALEARSYASPADSRVWLIMSTNSTTNPYTKSQTAYKLVPQSCPRFLLQKNSPLYPKAEFSEFDMWVTPYKDDQLFAGGRYLNNSGLPQWTTEAHKQGTTLEEADVVMWHVFRVSHLPRVEDYPVMPAETAGFTLKPYNFFKQNPSLDVPPPTR